MSKPSIPKGTRDFGPAQMARRNYIFDTIRTTFAKFGFAQIETPAMENLSTLTGKYGEEGDQLIFKILNNGDFLAKANAEALENKDSKKLAFSISKKALRYDLTVPFARFVVMNQNDLSFPFKRYQIQPVWRGDRPGKGRYQEFFQCDADVVGTDSLICEVELIQIFEEVLTNLRIPGFVIKVNNRKVLAGIAEMAGVSDQLTEMTVAIDKLDKIGIDKVVEELQQRGIADESISTIREFLGAQESQADMQERLAWIRQEFEAANVEMGLKGVEELEFIFDLCEQLGVNFDSLDFDITLARGLNYYTGAIFEVGVKEASVGSICGGGRYDDLTGIFGLKGVSGVGISFGADRIYDVLEEFDLFPSDESAVPKALFINFGEAEAAYCMKVVTTLRKAGIAAEVYPSSSKMKKQMNYANQRNYPYVVMVGSREMEANMLSVKNMATGDQEEVSVEEIVKFLS